MDVDAQADAWKQGDLEHFPWEDEVAPAFGFEDLHPAARHMLITLNRYRPGEWTELKHQLYLFLGVADG